MNASHSFPLDGDRSNPSASSPVTHTWYTPTGTPSNGNVAVSPEMAPVLPVTVRSGNSSPAAFFTVTDTEENADRSSV